MGLQVFVFCFCVHVTQRPSFFVKPTNKKKMTAIIYYCLICLYLFSFLFSSLSLKL